jgi:hypothetical protein
MNFLSFNVRGLGGRIKRKKVRDLVRAEKVDFLAIQETKLSGLDTNFCAGLWGEGEVDFSSKDSCGNAVVSFVVGTWKNSR